MKVLSKDIEFKTKADGGMVDVTGWIQDRVTESGLVDGIVLVFCPGSTGALSTVEYEPGLLKDVPDALDRIAPKDLYYSHHETWHDDNGRGHVKATLVGPDITIPFRDRRLTLGTWQQVCFIECDTSNRHRKLIVQLIGK